MLTAPTTAVIKPVFAKMTIRIVIRQRPWPFPSTLHGSSTQPILHPVLHNEGAKNPLCPHRQFKDIHILTSRVDTITTLHNKIEYLIRRRSFNSQGSLNEESILRVNTFFYIETAWNIFPLWKISFVWSYFRVHLILWQIVFDENRPLPILLLSLINIKILIISYKPRLVSEGVWTN